MERKHLTIDISGRSVFLIVVTIGLVVLFWHVRQTMLLVLTAVVFAALIDSLAGLLQKLRIPRVLALVLTYILFIGAFVGVLYVAIPVFVRELSEFIDMFPAWSQTGKALAPIEKFLNSAGAVKSLATTSDPFRVINNLWAQLTAVGFTQYAGQILGSILNGLLVIVLSFYLAVSDRGVDAFLRAVTPFEYENRIIRLWHRTEAKIGSWFRGQVLQSFILSALTYAGLLILGVPYAFILALLSLVLGLIPFGIILATIPAILLAYLGGGAGLTMLVLALYVVLHQIENYVLSPYIVRRSTGIPSVVVLLALILGGEIAGILGVILSIPVSVFLMEVIKYRESAKARQLEKAHE